MRYAPEGAFVFMNELEQSPLVSLQHTDVPDLHLISVSVNTTERGLVCSCVHYLLSVCLVC